eukprot:gene6032-2190_t
MLLHMNDKLTVLVPTWNGRHLPHRGRPDNIFGDFA